MANKITPKQKKFAQGYLETGNGTHAALEVYDTESENVAASIASENLRKPKVIAYLESKAERASERIVELSEQDEALPVALGASKDILDRAGFRPIEKSQNINLNLDANTTERTRELGSRIVRILRR